MTVKAAIYAVSDSTGETAEGYASSIMTQFPDLKTEIIRFSDINSKKRVDRMLERINGESIIVATIANKEVNQYLKNMCAGKDRVEIIDILGQGIEIVEKFTGFKALHERGLKRRFNDDYFKMIKSIEFTMQYDDGEDPRGLVQADIVLLGVSRSSKTPLSLYLSTKGYKVCNLPLVPEIPIPSEIYDVDEKKIIGLIVDEDKLVQIRKDSALRMGLDESPYYAKERIEVELKYANEIFEEFNCPVFNVTNKTIEETAAKIISYMKEI